MMPILAQDAQCGVHKLICTTVRLEKLFVANVQNQQPSVVCL
jgi:hypothetical protein